MYASQFIAVVSAFLIASSVSVLSGAAAKSTQKTTSSHPAASSHSTKAGGTRKTAKTAYQKSRKRPTASRRYVQMAPTPERYMEIQRAMAERGYYKGEINGVWDADAIDAMRRFQKDQNLTADGKIGSLSLISLGLGPKRDPIGDLAAKPASEAPPTNP